MDSLFQNLKNVEIWTRDTDRRILTVAGTAAVVTIAALIGAWIPLPESIEEVHWANGLISVALLIFVWGVFHIIRPYRYGRKWVVSELIAVPIVWSLLVLALALWIHDLRESGMEEICRRMVI